MRAINHHRQISLLGRKAESRYLLALRTSASPETFWESHPESDPNRGYAVTFFFYRVNKTQTVKFTLEAIERRVVDPAADTKVTNNSFASRGNVSTIPSAVLVTDKERLDSEGIGRTSVTNEQQATLAGNTRLQAVNATLLGTAAAPLVRPA